MEIAICIPTFNRPEGLKRLLIGINNIRFDDGLIKIIVIDNDREGTSKTMVDSLSSELKWELTYVIESRRGIPFARNRGVLLASNVDFIAFIDDDEVPREDWLIELLTVQKRYNADVVAGTVEPIFETAPPTWIKTGNFFTKTQKKTGENLKYVSTANVLVRKSVFENGKRFFNENMALTGGSDTYFFLGVFYSGYSMVGAEKAIVKEFIPQSRTRVNWLIKRSFRTGTTFTFCNCAYNKKVSYKVVRLIKATIKIGVGLMCILPSIFLGKGKLVRNIQVIAAGLGNIWGTLGLNYNEYKTIHGK